MIDHAAVVRRLGGLVATYELYAAGATRWSIARALDAGELRRVRQGWYCEPDIAPDLFRAARIGGLATCVTAARHMGLWIPHPDERLHVAVHTGACQLRDPDDHRKRLGAGRHVVHWVDPTDVTRHRFASRLIRSPADVIRDLVRCVDPETAFVITESALHRRQLTRSAFGRLMARLDAGERLNLRLAGRLSGSGTESLFVYRIRRRGVRVRQQVQIGVDRVDILIGDDLVVELDSREFHDPVEDSRRDARLLARGFRVIRFRYAQVMYDWPSVEAAVFGALSGHLIP